MIWLGIKNQKEFDLSLVKHVRIKVIDIIEGGGGPTRPFADHVGYILSENDHGRDGRDGRKWWFFATILLNIKNVLAYIHNDETVHH